MPLTLTFLEASIPLTKEYQKQATGEITKNNYPNVYEVTSHVEKCKTLRDVASTIQAHALKGHCLLKGNLSRDLESESRAGTTDPNAATKWLMLDVDGMDFKTPDDFMKAMGFADISYVLQYSASHHIFDKKLRCHILVELTHEISAPALKEFLKSWNFSIPELRNSLELTKTGMALKYGLDITTCQNDKLIYIAPPILKKVSDPLKNTKRISFVQKKKNTLTLPSITPSIVTNKALIETRIKELREQAGLPARKNTYRHVSNIEVLSKPDQATITGMKEDRGFVYFNFNGGDSWAYYHPANNADFIYNFKGEPTYVTKELLPEYWEQIKSKQEETDIKPAVANAKGIMYLAFLDRKTSSYWRGKYDTKNDVLELHMARNETQIWAFIAQNNFSVGEVIPEWDIVFDPHIKTRVDAVNRVINVFRPTDYMLAKPKKVMTMPPTCEKIIRHCLGGQDEEVTHFINWIAYILQNMKMTRTAWVLHGTEGTGKGLLFNQIIRPLLGEAQTAIRNMKSLAETYNDYAKNKLLVFIDEVQTSSLHNSEAIMAKLRNFIVEPNISIRQMYVGEYEVKNFSNWMFASNRPDPVAIPKEDRRFNVARYQPEKLVITQHEVETLLPAELQDMHHYLMSYKVDTFKANTPLKNADRESLIEVSEASIDSVASAIITGNFEFFMDHLPTTKTAANEYREDVDVYTQTLIRLASRTKNNGTCPISRDELFVLFNYCVGEMPKSPNKFTSRLKHHRIRVHKVWVDSEPCQGFTTMWKPRDLNDYLKRLQKR